MRVNIANIALRVILSVWSTCMILVPSLVFVCMYIPCSHAPNIHRLSFEVAEGGFLDVDVTLTDPSGSVIYAANQVHNAMYFL